MDRFQWFQLFAQLGVVHRICRLVVSRRGCPASKTGYAGGKIQMGQHFGAGRFEKWDPINLDNQFLAPTITWYLALHIISCTLKMSSFIYAPCVTVLNCYMILSTRKSQGINYSIIPYLIKLTY